MLTIKEALQKSTEFLSRKGIQTARLDAELLLAHILESDRLRLYLDFDKPLQPTEESDYRELIVRRGKHEPVAYLCGEKEFMSLPFFVTPAVLVPRPETELLVENALKILERWSDERAAEVFEVGVGSGAIAVSLLHYAKKPLRLTASDISPAALEIAQRNAERHGVLQSLQLMEADLFGDAAGPFDLAISNPPYVARRERAELAPDVAEHEPEESLWGGEEGLDVIRRLIEESAEKVRPGGWLLFEIGFQQTDKIMDGLKAQTDWKLVDIAKDLQNIPRVVILNKN